MSNTIIIKNGSGEPGSLSLAELGFDKQNEFLYIGNPSESNPNKIIKIGPYATAADVGAVPISRTVNGKALSSDIRLNAADVGAVPTTRTINEKALSSDITLSAADVGALAANGTAVSASKVETLSISQGSDLNSFTDYTTYYRCDMNATAATLSNCPTTNAFYMTVGHHAGVYQKIVEYRTSNPKIFFRNYYDGTWGSWYRVFTEANKPTAAEVGALSINGGSIPYLTLTSITDASGSANNTCALRIGDTSGEHLAIDTNEIIPKTSGTSAAGTLWLGESTSTIAIAGTFLLRSPAYGTSTPSSGKEGQIFFVYEAN